MEQQLLNAKENLKMQEEAYNLIKDQYKVALTDEITLSQSKYLLETTKMSIPKLEYQKKEELIQIMLFIDGITIILLYIVSNYLLSMVL